MAALIFKPLQLDSCCSGRVMCEISHLDGGAEKDRRVRVMSHLYSIATQMIQLMSTVIEFRERTPDALSCRFRSLYYSSFFFFVAVILNLVEMMRKCGSGKTVC